MSQEEHSAISELTATVKVLVTGFDDMKTAVKDLASGTDLRFREMSERGRFTRSDVFAAVSTLFAVLSGVGLLISMNTEVKLAPIRTENQVSIVDRAGLHEDVAKIQTRLDVGKDARYVEEKAMAVRVAVLEDHDRQRAADGKR